MGKSRAIFLFLKNKDGNNSIKNIFFSAFFKFLGTEWFISQMTETKVELFQLNIK